MTTIVAKTLLSYPVRRRAECPSQLTSRVVEAARGTANEKTMINGRCCVIRGHGYHEVNVVSLPATKNTEGCIYS